MRIFVIVTNDISQYVKETAHTVNIWSLKAISPFFWSKNEPYKDLDPISQESDIFGSATNLNLKVKISALNLMSHYICNDIESKKKRKEAYESRTVNAFVFLPPQM
jgi:hypothetical protein